MNQLYERIRVLCEEKNITIGELSVGQSSTTTTGRPSSGVGA